MQGKGKGSFSRETGVGKKGSHPCASTWEGEGTK